MHDTNTTQWPPPPLHPSVDLQEIKHIRLLRSTDLLVLKNLVAKRNLRINMVLSFLFAPFWLGIAILAIVLQVGIKTALDERARHIIIHGMPLLAKPIVSYAGLLAACSWLLYIYFEHRGIFVLDKQRSIFQRGGKDFCPLSELEGVILKPFRMGFIKSWRIQMVRQGKKCLGLRQWLTYPPRPNVTQIAAFRVREDAERLATFVADFIGLEPQTPEK